jgi:hypothetical protein
MYGRKKGLTPRQTNSEDIVLCRSLPKPFAAKFILQMLLSPYQ